MPTWLCAELSKQHSRGRRHARQWEEGHETRGGDEELTTKEHWEEKNTAKAHNIGATTIEHLRLTRLDPLQLEWIRYKKKQEETQRSETDSLDLSRISRLEPAEMK